MAKGLCRPASKSAATWATRSITLGRGTAKDAGRTADCDWRGIPSSSYAATLPGASRRSAGAVMEPHFLAFLTLSNMRT
jgi:hypothetical protein